jgi:hypothetical protein
LFYVKEAIAFHEIWHYNAHGTGARYDSNDVVYDQGEVLGVPLDRQPAMRIVEKHSHLNGEEYLIVHHKQVYEEIAQVVESVDAERLRTKVSREKRMKGRLLYSPKKLNAEFDRLFTERHWESRRYSYFVTTEFSTALRLFGQPLAEQKKMLIEAGVQAPIQSYKQTDFVKENVAIEVQFGKYAFVAYDLFVKHLLFYSGGLINLGIEILPVKAMQQEMSSGIAYYEGEVYNVLVHGRSNPPVPLLILGVAP